jgi:hypothetical protein
VTIYHKIDEIYQVISVNLMVYQIIITDLSDNRIKDIEDNITDLSDNRIKDIEDTVTDLSDNRMKDIEDTVTDLSDTYVHMCLERARERLLGTILNNGVS